MTEFLPGWVVVGAKGLLVWGLRDEHIEEMTITKITPSGQVVLNGNSRGERRFMLRDFLDDGTAHRYEGGTFATGSRDLYPMDHPKVPKLLAKGEETRTRRNVQSGISRWEKDPTPGNSQALRLRLEVWEQAVQMLEDV